MLLFEDGHGFGQKVQLAVRSVEGEGRTYACARGIFFFCSFFFLGFYLFMRDTEREAETQAEGEAGSMQGAQCGTQSQDPGLTP